MVDDDEPLFTPKKSARKREEADYDVGYGKPPVETQFKPGRSGNPKGRPRKTVQDRWYSEHAGILDIVRMVAAEPITISMRGKTRTVRYKEGYVRQLASVSVNNPAMAKVFTELIKAAEKTEPPFQTYDLSLLELKEVEELERLLEKATPPEFQREKK